VSPVSFAAYPRRIVATADGRSALVTIRTNVELEGMSVATRGGGSLINGLRRLNRTLKKDESWRVEVYDGQDHDQCSLPSEYPNRVLIVETKEVAVLVAERVCRTLATEGIDAVPGMPPSRGWLNDIIRRPRTFEPSPPKEQRDTTSP
jgi:hypothetical protein